MADKIIRKIVDIKSETSITGRQRVYAAAIRALAAREGKGVRG